MGKISFFRIMLEAEEVIVKDGQRQNVDGIIHTYRVATKQTILKLINQIQSGMLFKKKSSPKFICKHWRNKPDELVKLYKAKYDKEKRPDTFRGEISVISNLLYSIYGDISNIIAVEDMKEVEMLDNIVEAMNIEILNNRRDLFIEEVYDYADETVSVNEYNLADCKDEIYLLSRLSTKHMNNIMKRIDREKLFYLVNIILSQSIYDCHGVNHKKVELLKAVELI